jgi:ADP-ribosylglycohydrolase
MDEFPSVTVEALMGLACGDAFGAPFEYNEKAPSYAILSLEQGKYLDSETDITGISPSRARVPGLYTDDTQQALAMLWVWRALVLKGQDPTDADVFVKVLRRVLDRMSKSRAGPFGVHRGTGRNFRTAIQQGSPIDTAGMGAAMRIGPVATLWPEDRPEGLMPWIHRVSEVTTTNQLSKDAAALFGFHVWMASIGWRIADPTAPKRHLPIYAFYPEGQSQEMWNHLHRCLNILDWKGEGAMLFHAEQTGLSNKPLRCAANGFALTGIPWVLHCVRKATSYEVAMHTVCSSGGDTDTVGAMAGCLTAVNGESPPDWMVNKLIGKDHILSPHEWHPLGSEEPLTLMERDLRRERQKAAPKPQTT